MISNLGKADDLIKSLKTEPEFLLNRMKKMTTAELLELAELGGGNSGSGGSERKVPKIVQSLIPEVMKIVESQDFIKNAAAYCIEEAISVFIDTFHKTSETSDQARFQNHVFVF